MATNAISRQNHVVVFNAQSWFQKYFLRRFHPRSIFIDTVGGIWFTYYLWKHDWQAAIMVVLFARIIAYFAVAKIDVRRFSETTLGKIGLLHLHPMNFTIQVLGAIVLIWGIWQHSTEVILGGTSLVFLGHVFAWSQVDPRF